MAIRNVKLKLKKNLFLKENFYQTRNKTKKAPITCFTKPNHPILGTAA